MQERRLTPGLLLFSVCIFLSLMPGGPIDNRVFPDMPLSVALFLSLHANILAICAIFSIFQTRRGGKHALYWAACEGAGFASIYIIDISEIIPSATPMGIAVWTFDIVGLAAAVLLIASVMRDLRRPFPEINSSYEMSRGETVSLVALSIYVGAILTFIATVSTVYRHPALYVWYWMR